MGKIPAPDEIVELKGDPSNRRKGTKSPSASSNTPKCPSYFDNEEKKKWREVTKQIEQMGLLSETDQDAIEAYVRDWCWWVNDWKAIKADQTAEEWEKANPKTIAARHRNIAEIQKRMTKFWTEYGLTPAARARLRMPTDKKPSANKFEKLKIVNIDE
jgi:P27 family predicted phage terminase small subunit